MSAKLSNNAVSKLAASITTSDVTITVLPGEGAKFPVLSAGDWFPATLIKSTGEFEVVRCTARSSDALTVTRAQEGTAPLSFSSGDRIEVRLTAGVVDQINTDILSLFPTGFGPLPWSRVSPPTGWIFADGRILLPDTAYPALRTAYILDGFPYGQDGSGNPKIPDACGRVLAGRDNMSGANAGRLTGATALGVALGAQTHTLATSEMPAHNHGVSDPGHAHGVSDGGHTHSASTATGGSHSHTVSAWNNGGAGINPSSAGGGVVVQSAITSSSHAGHTHSVTVNGAATGVTVNGAFTGVTTQNAGTGGAHNNVQPTLVLNFIVKA